MRSASEKPSIRRFPLQFKHGRLFAIVTLAAGLLTIVTLSLPSRRLPDYSPRDHSKRFSISAFLPTEQSWPFLP